MGVARVALIRGNTVVPLALPDPAGPLSSELSPSAIAEANAAVNGVQQDQEATSICICTAWRVHSMAPPTTSRLAQWAKINSAKFLC